VKLDTVREEESSVEEELRDFSFDETLPVPQRIEQYVRAK